MPIELTLAIAAKIGAKDADKHVLGNSLWSFGNVLELFRITPAERRGVREDAAMADEKAKVLVVEDNAALSGVICFNLVRAGFHVTSANNGRQGLEMAQRGTYDLVLSDQQMPMMTGIQLCESLRQLPAHKRTPFILLTAKCMEIDFAKLQKNPGVSAALPKPFSPSELINCIEELLGAGCRS